MPFKLIIDLRFTIYERELKMIKNLLLITVLVIAILFVVKDFDRILRVQYCNDIYMGRGELITKCLNE